MESGWYFIFSFNNTNGVDHIKHAKRWQITITAIKYTNGWTQYRRSLKASTWNYDMKQWNSIHHEVNIEEVLELIIKNIVLGLCSDKLFFWRRSAPTIPVPTIHRSQNRHLHCRRYEHNTTPTIPLFDRFRGLICQAWTTVELIPNFFRSNTRRLLVRVLARNKAASAETML